MRLNLKADDRRILSGLVAGETIKEIADEIGIQTGTANMQMHRCRVRNSIATIYKLVAVFALETRAK